MDCLFCEIVKGTVPSTKVYEDETVLAFKDIHPIAPVHILIIPKEHTADKALDITPENSAVIAHIFEVIPQIAREQGIEDGFCVLTNSGEGACQSVYHLHFHLFGGEGAFGPGVPGNPGDPESNGNPDIQEISDDQEASAN